MWTPSDDEDDAITTDAAAETTSPPDTRGEAQVRPPRFTWTDLGLILLVTALVRWVSGAQRFTTLHTPDSEFYYSLGLFGSAVTDRAPDDYYYWTKLGIILPVRALSEVLPPLAALSTFHFVLTGLVAGSGYAVARLHWSRLGSCLAAAFAALNTVVLAYIGDPYASGAAVAALSLLFATATVWTQGRRSLRGRTAAALGAIGAWLLMINPYAMIVGIAGCAGVVLAGHREARSSGAGALARSVARAFGGVVAGFVGGLAVFLALGWCVFPGLNWYSSLGEFVTTADLSDWSDPTWRWLATQIDLLVPVSAAIVSLLAVVLDRQSMTARTAAGLSCVTFGVAIGYKLASDSNVLQDGVYNSMLWPAALLAVVLVASGTGEPGFAWGPVLVAVAAPIAWVAAGNWTAEVSTPAAVAAASAAAVVAGGLLAWARGGRIVLSATWPIASAGALLLAVLGTVFQVLQNGPPKLPEGTHSRVAYAAAFRPNRAADVLAQDAAVQSWLIGATGKHEQLLVWNEPGTRSAASMQLWGSNSLGPGFGEPVGSDELAQLREVRPDAIVVYAEDPARVAELSTELAVEWTVAPEACRAFPSENAAPSMHVCILRLVAGPAPLSSGTAASD